MPLSIVGTFGVMYLLGYSLNNLTLMALTISTGFVVDDAIVMIENIDRYLEEGDSPLDAALKGAGQIGFTIVSLTVSLIAVLIPLLFMGDIVGRLFREFAVTLAVTILVSAAVSLSLTPMMCAKLLKHRDPANRSRFYNLSEDFYNRVIAFYGRTLKVVLRHQTITLLVTVGTLVLTLFLYVIVPKGFFPVQDTGVILGIADAPQNISFTALADRQQALGSRHSERSGRGELVFVHRRGRHQPHAQQRPHPDQPQTSRRAHRKSASDIIRRLQPEVAQVEGITLFMQPVQDLTVEDRVSRTQFQYTMEDADAKELARLSSQLVDKLRTLPQLRDVASDQQAGGLQADVMIDRDTASRLGIFPQQIDNTLYDAFGQRQVSTIFTQLNQYHVILEVDPQFQQNPGSFKDLYVKSMSGHSSAAFYFYPDPHFQHFPGGQSPGSVSGGDSLVQSCAGNVPGRRDQGHSASGSGDRNTAQRSYCLSGNGGRVSKFAFHRTVADRGRHRHRVHRAWSSLRKLHSPHHDSFHAAVGRRGRDPGFAA